MSSCTFPSMKSRLSEMPRGKCFGSKLAVTMLQHPFCSAFTRLAFETDVAVSCCLSFPANLDLKHTFRTSMIRMVTRRASSDSKLAWSWQTPLTTVPIFWRPFPANCMASAIYVRHNAKFMPIRNPSVPRMVFWCIYDNLTNHLRNMKRYRCTWKDRIICRENYSMNTVIFHHIHQWRVQQAVSSSHGRF